MASAAARPPRTLKPSGRDGSTKRKTDAEVQVSVRELAGIVDYIARVKEEIAALRPNELCRDRIPSANSELGNVVEATASATHTIMAAAEDILGAGKMPPKDYRTLVETRVMEIFEACSFQDITGQRIAKVLEALGHLERRLGRFASAVKVSDSETTDPEELLRKTRCEILLLNGPQAKDQAIAQDDIDKLFD